MSVRTQRIFPSISDQAVLFIGSSVLTGCAVSAAGSIGFVGLVTPHLARLALGSDNRVVLPAAAMLGGALLMAADLAARVLIAPRQLPVGALTALERLNEGQFVFENEKE